MSVIPAFLYEVSDRLWILVRRRRSTVSAVATEVLDEKLPRWTIMREGQGDAMEMHTACYYTLSTIRQTLAVAFGFLVAIVEYRMQAIGNGLPGKTRPSKKSRPLPASGFRSSS